MGCESRGVRQVTQLVLENEGCHSRSTQILEDLERIELQKTECWRVVTRK